MGMYGLQNWMFYTYLVQVESTDVYVEEKTAGGFLSKGVKIKTRVDNNKNPLQLIIIDWKENYLIT